MANREWLQSEFFIPVLEKDDSGFRDILECTTTAAIPPGGNFASVLLRSHLKVLMKDGSQVSKSYIIKTMVDDDKGGEVFKTMGLFPKERKMYLDYLPAFEALYRNAGLHAQLSPKCLHIEESHGRIDMVFEDLKAENFRNADKVKGLDFAHMRETLQKIAEFHAASAVFRELHGAFPEEFKYAFVLKDGEETIRKFYGNTLKGHLKSMAKWCQSDEEKAFLKKIPTVDQYLAVAFRTLEPIETDFNCLNHGDFWSSNVMYKYNPDGSISQVLLLDFQCCKWGSPCEDLLTFITLSGAKDVRFKEFDRLIKIYHERLAYCLELLGYQKPIPKLRDLHMALMKENVSFYPFFAVINHLPLILWASDEKSIFENLFRDDEIGDQCRERLHANPHYMEHARDIYHFYHNKGIFNFDDMEKKLDKIGGTPE